MHSSLVTRLCIAYVVVGCVLRMMLVQAFGPSGVKAGIWVSLLAAGAAIDALVAIVMGTLPRLVALVMPRRIASSWLARLGFTALVSSLLLYEAAVEYFFFDEFNSRFNHILLDYLLYPTEVFDNIRQSLPVGRYAMEALVGGLILAYLVLGRPRVPAEDVVTEADDAAAAPPPEPSRAKSRARRAVGSLLAGAAALWLLTLLPTMLVEDRVLNEVVNSGVVQLARAVRNASLDYDAFYLTLPRDEARRRAAATLGFPPPAPERLAAADFRLVRHVKPARRGPPLRSVVVVLEESFGAEFVGCLSAYNRGWTPDFDRWAARGLLLTNLFATGNRTVRGLESVLCSMVPLPGDSIVKRSLTDRVTGLPTVMAELGYRTAFFYGGRGVFDNLKNFAMAIGYGTFHEQANYRKDAFTTAWGVADEYIFDAALERQVQAKRTGEKLFVTILSVSNHKPYLVPPGRTGRPEGERLRNGAVRYADWALGRYLDGMRSHGLLEDTAVLVVGDHGARVYGSERIPIRSYRIPALFLVPDEAWSGRRLARVASQIDLPTTLLSLAGVECDVPFFGADVSTLPDAGGRAFVQHNHEVGLVDDHHVALLELRRRTTTYQRVPDDGLLELPGHSELEQDAAAVFQTAHELYEGSRFNAKPRP